MNIKERLQDAIASVAKASYIGSVMQCLKIVPDTSCPTAGVTYHKPTKSIVMIYSPDFMSKLTREELKAVFIHGIDHILRKHIYIYNNQKTKQTDAKRLNFAMDLVINQHVPNLPEGALYIEHFKTKDGKDFPKHESTETYYDLLDGAQYENPDTGEKTPVQFDVHDWDNIEPHEILDATGELIKRAQYVHEKSHGTKSKELSDLLAEISKVKNDIDYKILLRSTLRNAIPSKDIKKTWTRPSRRFGLMAKGSKIKDAPSVSIYCDTSGSIGYDELNSFVGVVTDVIKQGVNKINLHLFHERLYNSLVFKKGHKFEEKDLQAGGTELSDVMEKIKTSPDEIHIVLTDGHYSTNRWHKDCETKKVVFLIRQGGNLEHPLKGLGKTVEYKNV